MGSSKRAAVISVIVVVAVIVLAYLGYSALTSAGAGASGASAAVGRSAATSAAAAASEASASAARDAEAASAESAKLPRADSVYASLESRFIDLDGRSVTWADFADGHPVIVNFWATWCPYCVDEMDDYQQLYERFGDDVTFVMMDACDGQRETREKAEQYLFEHEYTFPVYYDTTYDVVYEFGVQAYPTTVVFTSEGDVEYAAAGRMDTAQITKMLQSLV